MTGIEAYELYKSIRLHFNSESYNCFKYAFKTGGTSEKSFSIRKDKFFFVKLGKQYSREELIGVLAANFYTNPETYIRELVTLPAQEIYTNRRKVVESLSYHFQKDVEFLCSQGNPDNLLHIHGTYPPLLEYVWSSDIEVESLIILNHLLNFFPTWDRKIQDTIQWPKFYFKVKKYTPFISFDGMTMKRIVQTVLDKYK